MIQRLLGCCAFNHAISEPVWRTEPSWYLVTTEDKMSRLTLSNGTKRVWPAQINSASRSPNSDLTRAVNSSMSVRDDVSLRWHSFLALHESH